MTDFQPFRLGDAINSGQGVALNQLRLTSGINDVQAQQGLQQATQAGTPEAMDSYRKNFPVQAQAFDTKNMEFKKHKIEYHMAELETMGRLASGVTDQPSYERALSEAKQLGIDTSNAPPQFDPNWAKQTQEQAYSAKDRLAAAHQQIELLLKTKTHAETERHNRESERLHQEDINVKKGSPENIEAGAQALADYTGPVPTGFALRSPVVQQQMTRAKQINPDYDVATHQAVQKGIKDFGTGKQGNTVRSFNVGLSHLDTLEKLADALNNGDTQLVNKIGNAVATQTGQTAPTNFESAKKIVGDEIVKAIVGSGGGVADRDEIAKTISAASSPAQLKGVINTYKELMVGQLGGLEQQYESTTKRKDFKDKYLSKEARDVYARKAQPAPAANTEVDALLKKYGGS
jgi:hypothetical protein